MMLNLVLQENHHVMLTSLYCRNTAQELNELENPDKMLLPTGIFCVGVALLLCFAKHFFTDYFAI